MMTRLLQLLGTSQIREVQEMCISTMSAVAASADRKFIPYSGVSIGCTLSNYQLTPDKTFALLSSSLAFN